MFPNFLITNSRQLRMRHLIHINDRNAAASLYCRVSDRPAAFCFCRGPEI
jgi:hypothetical protein